MPGKKSKYAKQAIKQIRNNPSNRAQILDEVGHTKGYMSKDAADVNYSRASQRAYKKGIRDEVKFNKITRKETRDYASDPSNHISKSEANSIRKRNNKTNRQVARIDKKIINKASRAYRTGDTDIKDGQFRTAPKVSNKIDELQDKRIEVLNSPYKMYGKDSGAMMSESPLAKTGCSKKYSPARLNGGEDEKLKAAKKPGKQSDQAKEAISKSKEEGYNKTSVKEKGNIRSTVLELKPKTQKPQRPNPPQQDTETKQFVGLSTPRKGLGKILGQ